MIGWLKRLIGNSAAPRRYSGRLAGIEFTPMPRQVPEPLPDATMWDVGHAFEDGAPEPGRIEYRFLGVTGEEDA